MTESTKLDPAASLPPELFQLILSQLEVKTLLVASHVSKQWKPHAESSVAWRPQIQRVFGPRTIPCEQMGSARYKHLHQSIYGNRWRPVRKQDQRLTAAIVLNCENLVKKMLPGQTFDSESLQKLACKAAEVGAWDAYKCLIDFAKPQAPVHPKSKRVLTPLHCAAKHGSVQMVRYLILRGANLNVMRHGRTALHYAVDGGHFEVVKALITAGAKLDAGLKTTPVYIASSAKVRGGKGASFKMLTLLLKHGADPDYLAPKMPTTPLTCAAQHGSDAIVKTLIESGARPGKEAFTRLLARKRLNDGLIQCAFKVRSPPLDTMPFLHCVLQCRGFRTATKSIASGCYPIERDTRNRTLLEQAIAVHVIDSCPWQRNAIELEPYDQLKTHGVELFRLLCKLFDINEKDSEGRTPFLQFVQRSRGRAWSDTAVSQAVRLFIESGADLFAPDNKGQTSLHLAIRLRWARLLQELCVHCDKNHVNAQDHLGVTPLHYAVLSFPSRTTMDLLISNGANPKIVDKGENTALHMLSAQLVCLNKNKRLFLLGHEHIAENNVKSFFSTLSGVNPWTRNRVGKTPLSLLEKGGLSHLIDSLLPLSSPVNSNQSTQAEGGPVKYEARDDSENRPRLAAVQRNPAVAPPGDETRSRSNHSSALIEDSQTAVIQSSKGKRHSEEETDAGEKQTTPTKKRRVE